MDGKALRYRLRQALNEASDSEFIDDRSSYEFMWQAAIEFVNRTNCLTSTQTVTTVADQANYTLNADYLKLYLKNDDNNYYIKYNDGTQSQFILFKEKEEVIYQNSTASQTIPSSFYIEDDSIDSQITSTATAAGGSTGGKSRLTDTATSFSDVSAGDLVHNLTDGSDGYVVNYSSSGVLDTALFGGTSNDWTNLDSYVIQPQGRFRLVLNPPPSTASHTITFYYVQRPTPVFTNYGIYRFQPQHEQAIIFYAAWLYKYRDREPDFGDKYFTFFENQIAKSRSNLNRGFNRNPFRVNFKKRR